MAAKGEPTQKKPRVSEPSEQAAIASPQKQGSDAPASGGGHSASTPSLNANTAASSAGTAPLIISKLLGLQAGQVDQAYLSQWMKETKAYVDEQLLVFLAKHSGKVGFRVPNSLLMISPLAIAQAGQTGALSAFREVMNHNNLMTSFSKNGMYEAAGTAWMLDPLEAAATEGGLTLSQLENAMSMWSEEAFLASSTREASRRYCFEVPFPAKVTDANVAQKEGASGVLMARPLPLLAGRAILIGWYGVLSECLQSDQETRVLKLVEAGLSVPIRLHLTPDGDSCRLAALTFAENLYVSSAASGADSFWRFVEQVRGLIGIADAFHANSSIPKLMAAFRAYGDVYFVFVMR